MMDFEKIVENPLFHLSKCNDIKKLIPHIPYKLWHEHEDNYIERICFSDSINGCLRALYANELEKFNVYVPSKQVQVYNPTSHDVLDQEITHEIWGMDEVPVIKIGEISVVSAKCMRTHLIQEIYIPETNFTWKIVKIKRCASLKEFQR